MTTSRYRLLAVIAGLLILTGGCTERRTFEQNADRLIMLVDSAFVAAMDGRPMPPKARLDEGTCPGPGFKDGEVEPSYEYRFPLSDLGEVDMDKFVSAVEAVWRSEGIRVDRTDDNSVRVQSYGGGEGFNLNVLLSRETGMANIGGNGPCTQPPSDGPAVPQDPAASPGRPGP
ncbi:MAG: hypothetical protein ACT4OM_01160 [Actinomycetota bacterium]